MLRQRIVTAAILAAIVFGSIFFLSSDSFSIVVGVFVLAGAWEWSRLIGLQSPAARVIYLFIVAISGLSATIGFANDEYSVLTVLGLAFLWWAYVSMVIWKNSDLYATMGRKYLAGLIILVPSWIAPVYLHRQPESGIGVLLYLLILVWLADSAAYFIGRKFGTTKLAPKVSPGKTVEGAIGGFVAVGIFSAVAGVSVWKMELPALLLFILIALVTAWFSIVGDLAESKIKRLAGVKDSGQLLPGHGGVLDRVDALTAAAPVFTLAWSFFREVS